MGRKGGFYGWTLLVVLWIIMVANCGFPYVGASVLNAYMAAELHLSRSTLGLAFAVFQWLSGLPGPLIAICVGKKGVRFTLTIGSLLLVAGAVLMAMFVRTGAQAVIAFGLIIGLGTVAGGPLPAQAGITRWFVRKKALAISVLLTGGSIGAFVAPPILTRVVEAAGGNWRAGWWLVAGCSLLSVLLSLGLVREKPSDLGQLPDGAPASVTAAEIAAQGTSRVYRTVEDWSTAEVVRSRSLWWMILCGLGFSGGFSMFLAHGVIHLRDLGHAPSEAAYAMSVMALVSLAATLLVGALGDRIEPRFFFAGSALAIAAGMLVGLNARTTAGLYSCALLLGIGFGSALPAMLTLAANYFGEKAYPAVVGIMMSVGTLVGAGGSYAAGIAYDHFGSYARAFYPVSVVAVLGFAFVLFMRPPVRTEAHSIAMAADTQ